MASGPFVKTGLPDGAHGYSGTPCESATAVKLVPTTNAATVIPDGAVVVYGDSNIVTNYDPGWGQFGNGQVDPVRSRDRDLVLAYPNFNYQGTEIQTMDLSDMTHLHVDIWSPREQPEWPYLPQSRASVGGHAIPWSK